MRLALRSGLHKRAPPPVYRQSRAEKSPLSGLAKGRGSCLRRSIVVTCKRSRRVAGKAERAARFRLSRPAAPTLPSRKRGLVEFSHLRSLHTQGEREASQKKKPR